MQAVWIASDVVESTKSESESFASESESLKIWTRVRLEYTVGLEYYITVDSQPESKLRQR